jgi:hypothetical protein
VVARLWDLPGVEAIYFEDSGHALKLAKLSNPEHASEGTFSDALYVKFSDPALARALTSAVKSLPGVLMVVPVSPEE